MAKLAVLIGHLCFWLGTSNPSVCGSEPDEVPGCQMKDMGSCGNACCVVEVALKKTPEQTYELTKKTLQEMSEDGFTYVTGGEPNPGDDLRPYNISSPEMFKFILQGRHDAPKYYGTNGDILNFAIYQTSGASVLRMFSVSRIHGALGDNGQNYKSLSFLAEKMQIQSELVVKHGCGAPLSLPPKELNLDSSDSASFPSYCGAGASKDPDCARKDFGSCGNACCLVELQLNQSPEKVHQALIDGLTPSNGFSYVTGGQPDPADDLRPYNITSPENFQFIAQGRHDAPEYYGTNGDILNFAIYQTSGASVLRMFSVSRIHGALGDNGQNYKSLSLVAKTFNADMNIKYGCGMNSEVNLV